MSWVQSTLGEVADIFSGYAFKSADMNSEGGTPLIKIKNIADSAVSHECDAFLNKDFDLTKYERFHLLRDDFLVAMTGQGSVGRIGKMRGYKPGFYVNQRVSIVRVNSEKANPIFIFYQIATHSNELELFNKANGAGQPNISAKQIGELPVVLPPVEKQQHIADVLSAYDDLIENNQKQIKLLEETAQRLYKEWFVDLRFPGHETTPIIDGVPEGWSTVLLSDVASINAKSLPKNFEFDYIDYVDLGSVNYGHISGKTRYTMQEAPGRAKRQASNGDIIWGMVRPNLRSYALILHPKETDVFSTGFAILSAHSVPFSFLYSTVTTDAFVGYLVNCTNGAAYPAVKPEHFANAKMLIPHQETLNRFDKYVCPLFDQIHGLQKQNENLAEARDRLLPKLMNGELEA